MEKLLRNKTYKIAPVLAAIFLFLIADTSRAQEKPAVDATLKRALIIFHNFDPTFKVKPDYDSLEWALSVLRPHSKTDEARASLDSFETSLRRMRSADSIFELARLDSVARKGTEATAGVWNYLTTDADNDLIYVRDRKKMKRGIFRVWIKYVNSVDTVDFTKVKEQVELAEYDCQEQRSRSINITSYFVGGDVQTRSKPSDWTYTIPESVGEKIAYFACSGRLK